MVKKKFEWLEKGFGGSFESIHISLIHVLSVVRLSGVFGVSWDVQRFCSLLYFPSHFDVINLMIQKIKKNETMCETGKSFYGSPKDD